MLGAGPPGLCIMNTQPTFFVFNSYIAWPSYLGLSQLLPRAIAAAASGCRSFCFGLSQLLRRAVAAAASGCRSCCVRLSQLLRRAVAAAAVLF